MNISKTMFKEISKCYNFFYLDNLLKIKKHYPDKDEETLELLRKMYNEDGDNLIRTDDLVLEQMMKYYKQTEEYALKQASILFKKNFVYSQENKEQKIFKLIKDKHNFYTYLDGYYEDDDEIIVIEVKATSTRKFLELGPKINGALHSIFHERDGVLKLKDNINEKEVASFEKIYNRNSDVGQYFYDFAVTKFFSKDELAFKNKKISFYLGILNSDYVYNGKMKDSQNDYFDNVEPLFKFIYCNNILENYNDIIYQDFLNLLKYLNVTKPEKKFLKICPDCIYCPVCFENYKNPLSIKTLLVPKKIGDMTLVEMINNGYEFITDIPYDLLEKENHKIQRNSIEMDKEIIQEESIKTYLDKIKYPIYHLDFESLSIPIPRFYGEKPYFQSVFQFSIHIQRAIGDCNKDKDNYYFLPSDFEDHREELIKEMIRIIDLSKGGTVLVYNESFEKCRINEFINIFPKYKKELEIILEHIYDLKDVIKGVKTPVVNYYHPLLQGSYSIKKVLPVFSNLSYNQLDVQNGMEAVCNYIKFSYLPNEEIQVLREKLLEYCGLDTYSMAIILDNINKKVGRGITNE